MLKNKKKTYGNTWWGKAWLDALEKIDSSRLDRGKNYANQGKIKSLKIADGNISASVKGAYQNIYSIKISFEKFTASEIKKIKRIITQTPSVGIELGMGILPEELLELMEIESITLLPNNWDDLKSKCTCPDIDNPCKHLAAVYYMVANEIDKDPFMLFSLKGLDTKELIKLSGIDIQSGVVKNCSLIDKFVDYTELNPKVININIDNFEFSYPKYDIKSLLALLLENPPFYNEGDFKEFIEKIYKVVPQQISSVIPQIEGEPALIKNDFYVEFAKDMYSPQSLFKVKVVPDKNSFYEDRQKIVDVIEKNHISNYKNNSMYDWKKQTPTLQTGKINALTYEFEDGHFCISGLKTLNTLESDSVLEYFLNMPININFDKSSDSFAFLNILSSVALGLVKASMFLPEVVFESDETFTIRYIPIVKEPRIENIIDELKQIMPVDICSSGNKFMTEEGITDLLSIFITNIVKRVLRRQNIVSSSKIVQAFCNDYLFRANEFTEKSIGKSISNWLEKLYISKKDVSPLIRFEKDLDNDFKVYIDIAVKNNTQKPVIEYKDLFDDISQELFAVPLDKVKNEVASQVIFASEYFKELKQIINSKGNSTPVIPVEKISEVFLNTVDIFRILGIEVVFPKEFKKIAFPQLRAKAKVKKTTESGESYLNLHELLEFSYEIAIGDEKISANEFIQLVNETQGLVKYKNSYILIKPEDIQNILNKLKEPVIEMSSSVHALYTAISGEINGVKFDADESLLKILDDFTKIEEISIPENLIGTLRPYQERGFKWLYSNAKKGFGSCLADDMGLGKTIQVIALLLNHKNTDVNSLPSLVICPTTLIGNWEKECKKFAPSLNLNIYHGVERQLELEKTDVLITSYSVFRRDIKQFANENWKFLIVDESQNIKNSETLQTKAIKSLKAENYIAMTGTPVENRLTELWNIFDFINKGYMGSLSQFKSRLATPIEKYKDKESVDMLKKATAPFILRRLKTDKSIITDLPDKISFDEYCYLTKEQAAIYQNIVEETMNQIEGSGGIQRKGLIFKLITSLKQICNHPAHYSGEGVIDSVLSGKTSKALSIIETILSNKEKALIFTQYRKMGDLLQDIIKKELNEEAIFFHGGITRKKRDEMVNMFQNERKARLMIISLKAGGTGLNLTEASNVIHYDLWWNPAVEEQATDRAYRIGQDKNVIVHRLITLGTFEEKIDEIIKSKKELADLTISTGENWITELSNKDLRDIFTLYK